jgi:hypothetical protein
VVYELLQLDAAVMIQNSSCFWGNGLSLIRHGRSYSVALYSVESDSSICIEGICRRWSDDLNPYPTLRTRFCQCQIADLRH